MGPPPTDSATPDVDERTSYRRGIELFNAGRFFEAHEVWEDAWRPGAGLRREPDPAVRQRIPFDPAHLFPLKPSDSIGR